ncbi:MAG: alpha-amylase family glycosyl hydrolase [Steroidobacteraceae bacterium]
MRWGTSLARLCLQILLASLCAPLLSAGAPLITFDTQGGDAWSFEHPARGTVAHGVCDVVLVRSAGGSEPAFLDGGRFVATVHLRSGDNELRAQCRRGGKTVAQSKIQHWKVGLPDMPRAWIRTRVDGGTVVMDAGRSELAPGIPAPIVRYEWRTGDDNPAPLQLGTGKQIAIRAPASDGIYHVILRVTDAMGRYDESTGMFRNSGGRAAEIEVDTEHPAWTQGAVVYGIPLPLVTPYGFEGARKRLDAIKALGASIVWLSPVTEAPPGDFGYAVTDQFRVRSAFGTAAQLHALIEDAHARGLKVFLDLVSNHLSAHHRYYEETEHLGVRSAYYDWFERDAGGKPVHYFDWTQLQNLNYDNGDVRGYMTAAFVTWVRDYHVDGFRLDASWAVRERAPEFWPQLFRELKRINPDIALLAEAAPSDPYYAAHRFDAAYDWTPRLGEWAWQGVFGPPDTLPDLARLREALKSNDADPARPIPVLHFMNNNDTGARFLTRHGIEQTRDAAALLLTLTGMPLIYAGDEVGAAYDPYTGGPPISWFDAYGLERFYTHLVELRRTIPALRSGSLRLLVTDHDDSVLAFLREPRPPDPPVLVVINFGPTARQVHLPAELALAALSVGPHQFRVVQP